MLALLLLASETPALAPGAKAAVDGAVAAERKFAVDAQAGGQWPAFRAAAAADAITFTPQPTPVSKALKDAKEPAIPVMWWPATVFAACDGALAVNSGPWVLAAGGGFGTFTTVWRRQPGGKWKWQLDHGRDTPRFVAAGREPKVRSPDCTGATSINAPEREAAYNGMMARLTQVAMTGLTASMFDPLIADDMLLQRDGAMPETGAKALPAAAYGERIGFGHDVLWTMVWESYATSVGGHDLRVWQWRGPAARWQLALYELAEPKAP